MGTVQIDGSTPKLTIGNATAEDATILFDGNAQDFYIALDDSADDLLIGKGSTVGTTPAIAIDENLKVNIPVTTASTSASTGSLTTGGGAGIGADLYVGDDAYLITDSAVLGFGADKDTLLTHTDGTGVTLNSTNKLCFNDATQFVQGSSGTVLSIGATDEIDLTATAVDLNGTLDVSGTSQFNAAVTLAGTTPTLTIGDAGAEDTKFVFDGNAQDWHIGLDDSTDDFVIGLGSTLGTTSHIVIDETGAVTKPLQPAFGVNSATMSNLALNTTHTITFNTERFDQGSDFDTGTYTFTAPVTGKYQLNVILNLEQVDADESYYRFKIVTSNHEHNPFLIQNNHDADMSYLGVTYAVLADMDAGDTAYVAMHVTNAGAAQADISNRSYFSGHLAC